MPRLRSLSDGSSLIAFSAHVSASSGCACFCGISAARSRSLRTARRNARQRNGEEGPLADPLQIRLLQQYSGIVSNGKREMGRKSRSATSHTSRRRPGSLANHQRRAGDEEMGLIRAMHSRHGVRARWGYGDRNMDFATLPVMPESARRGREERHRTYHTVCR